MTLQEIVAARAECDEIDFKGEWDPSSQRDRCELLKDIVAIGNHGGGGSSLGCSTMGGPWVPPKRPAEPSMRLP
jgi:hypothetical protein